MSAILGNPTGVALVMLLLKASVLLGVAVAIQGLLGRRSSAAMRHGVWALAVTSLLLLPALTVGGPEFPLVPLGEQAAGIAPDRASNVPFPTTSVTPSPATVSRSVTIPSSPATPSSPRDAARWNWPAIAIALYAAGALILLARLVADHLAARRLVAASEEIRDRSWTDLLAACAGELSVTRPVRLLRASGHVMPMVVGLRRSAILLSSDADTWTAERRRSVILHELAHVQRRDCLTQTLASLATTLYWPHPGVWWVARRLRVEREFACDDRVIAAGAAADAYATDLLEIAYTLGARRSPALAVTMARRGQLEGRLLAVLDVARNRATPGLAGRAAIAIGALAVLVPVAAIGVTTQAAALPVTLDETPSVVGVPQGSGVLAPHTAPRRLAKTLYSWGDVVQGAVSTSGTWAVQPSEKTGEVYLEMRQLHSNSGHSMPLSQLQGLTTAQMTAGGPVKFALTRDAGTFTFEGVFRDGVGGGAYSYAANPSFPDQLAQRGIDRPTAMQQYEMAKDDVSLALVDDLRAQGYQTPTVDQLVQAGQHGVSGSYVREMGALGYKVGTLAALINMRDHGVSVDYVHGMMDAGLPKLSAEDLVRARDHGVTPDYVQVLGRLGYASLSLDALVNARDHGISSDYVKAMSDLGYKLTLDELRTARDHGITPDYIRGLGELGFSKLSLEALVNARNHGVTPDYVKELQALGHKPTLEALINARDHGVTPDYARALKDLGYAQLSLDELATLRDHGATPERVKRANDKAGTRLSPDMLRTVMDGGLR